MTGGERSNILLKAADLIASRLEELAYLDAIEAGKPISQCRGELGGAVDIWRYAASLARNLYGESYNNLGEGTMGVVLRDAIGVVSIITPWNFPFLIVSQKLPFALAAGCTTVVKPSELTSGSTLVLGEILMAAGVPEGSSTSSSAPARSRRSDDHTSRRRHGVVHRLHRYRQADHEQRRPDTEESVAGTRRQEPADRLSLTPISTSSSMRRCSAPISTPANAAMPARG
jgi:hypothetical protein